MKRSANCETRRFVRAGWVLGCVLASPAAGQGPGQGPANPAFDRLLPTFYAQQSERLTYPLSWLSGKFDDFDAWRTEARGFVLDCLLMAPPKAKFEPKVVKAERRDGYVVRTIEMNLSGFTRCEVFVLVPEGDGPFPGVVVLHDHGAEFRWGKAKVVRTAHAKDPDLKKFVDQSYGGRFIGDVLARRGYVVLAADAAFWGDRQHAGGSKYEMQQAIGSNMMQLGMTWPGLVLHEDLASVEFLAGLPVVDPERIGCVGLSMGCYRSWHVAALSDRIRAGVGVGWMATNASLAVPGNNQTGGQSAYSMLIPGVRGKLDYPDEAAMACPKPMLFYNGSKDGLFPTLGAKAAFAKMRKIWASQGAADKLETKFWPVPHEFNRAMQEEAFDWLDGWLKK